MFNWWKKKNEKPKEDAAPSKKITMEDVLDNCIHIDNRLHYEKDMPTEEREKLMSTRRKLEELKMWMMINKVWTGK